VFLVVFCCLKLTASIHNSFHSSFFFFFFFFFCEELFSPFEFSAFSFSILLVFSLSSSLPLLYIFSFISLLSFFCLSHLPIFSIFLFHSFLFVTFTDSLRHFSISGNDAAVPNLSFACPPVHPCFLGPQSNASRFVFYTQIHILQLNQCV